MLVLCHYRHFCLLQSDQCLSVYLKLFRLWFCVTMSSAIFILLPTHYVPHNVPYDGSVSLCPLLFYIISTLLQPQAVLSFVQCHCALYYLLHSLHLISTSQSTLCCFLIIMSTADFWSVHPLSTCNCTFFVSLFLRPILSFKFCPLSVYFSLYDLLFLCQYIHCYLLHSVHCLTTSQCTCITSVSLYPLPSSAVCPLYVYLRLYSLWFSVSVPTAIVHIL